MRELDIEAFECRDAEDCADPIGTVRPAALVAHALVFDDIAVCVEETPQVHRVAAQLTGPLDGPTALDIDLDGGALLAMPNVSIRAFAIADRAQSAHEDALAEIVVADQRVDPRRQQDLRCAVRHEVPQPDRPQSDFLTGGPLPTVRSGFDGYAVIRSAIQTRDRDAAIEQPDVMV